ncbi:MAG: hypothetical protein LBE37_13985 [Sphingobacterium sp.]|jgi:hypothetical protein|nr:hypothetical protein [Sphingobacterium sp.]
MNKLDQQANAYIINRKKSFLGVPVTESQLRHAIDFSYAMIYGDGHHRSSRSGGQTVRSRGEKFCNTFQGKLAEIVLHDLLVSAGIAVSGIDFSIHGEGIWDDCDLIANGRRINIKSAASFSNLLLLEQKDWNAAGEYKPDLEQGKSTTYDAFVLIRFGVDVKGIFSAHKLFYSNEDLPKSKVEPLILAKGWKYDFAGFINNNTFRYLIEQSFVIPQGALLNGKIPMDASNYYCQAGDMQSEEIFIERLKTTKCDAG